MPRALPLLFRKRSIWWPTWIAWLGLFLLLALPGAWWCLRGEAFLRLTDRAPDAKVLLVEGWIGIDGIQAAKQEFTRGGYDLIITAGGQMHHRWSRLRWNEATEAQEILVRAGIPTTRVIAAPAPEAPTQRTFASAEAARKALQSAGIGSAAVNVFSAGIHSRRSWLVFSKALGRGYQVGIVAWCPPECEAAGPWWKSSDQAKDFLTETAGYLYEALLSSGRWEGRG